MSDGATAPPSVPGVGRLAWLMFMQPLKLRGMLERWRLKGDPSLVALLRRMRANDPIAKAWLGRMALILAIGAPLSTLLVGGLAAAGDAPVGWEEFFVGVFGGILAGAFFSEVIGVGAGVSLGILLPVLWTAVLILQGFPAWMVLVATIGTLLSLGRAFGPQAFWLIALGSVVSFAARISLDFDTHELTGTGGAGPSFGGLVNAGLALAVPVWITYWHLPLYVFEAPWTLALAAAGRKRPHDRQRLANLLPLRRHDVIRFPLPGLRSFLVDLSETDPGLAQEIVAEAAASTGQKRPARLALAEIQARQLEHAARERLFARMAVRDLPFLPAAIEEEADPFTPFQAASRDLQAARVSRNHLHRRRALERAERALVDGQNEIVARRRPTVERRRLLPVYRLWLDVVRDEVAALTREAAEKPQIPIPFVAGPALSPDDIGLFKGRRDLVRIIDHDLTGDRRAPLLLFGQRRMGKSSLLNILPVQLGTGTAVAQLNFQGLSGSPFRARPHAWVAREVAALRPGVPRPPEAEAPWNATLDWLLAVEKDLERTDHRILVAIDEVERLEDGIRDGWAGTEFLDFVRAGGDSLRRIRFLLATAHPLPRLGTHWVDRLINVLLRRLEPLDEASARALIQEPMPGFPDIYPPGGVERILAETAGHPYLIQMVCDILCRKLNEQERLRATDDDLERALDRALVESPLFDELWRQRTEPEKAVLRGLASAGQGEGHESEVLRSLEQEGHLTRKEEGWGLTLPLFATWIAERS